MMRNMLWQQIPSPIITEILCVYCDSEDIEYDGVVLDTEHGPFSDETIYTCIQIATLAGRECFVRVTHLDKKLVRMILDAGATGIIFSTIESKEQTKEIMDFCKYPPKGYRGQGLVRENAWGKKELGKAEPILVGQIETAKGVMNLCYDYIVESFDYFLIGPYDLSASLGSVGDFESPEYKDCIQTIEEKIPKDKMGYHIVSDIKKQVFENGYGEYPFLAFSTDVLMITGMANSISEALN